MVCATRGSRRSSLQHVRPALQDLRTRRRHFEDTARRHAEANSSGSLRRARLPFFGTRPSSSAPASPQSPQISAETRLPISAESAHATLSRLNSNTDALEHMSGLLKTLQIIHNSNDEDAQSENYLSLAPNDDVRAFAHVVASEPFLCHHSDHIRLLSVCCLAEVFRICAPNPPMHERDMAPVCTVILEQLCVFASQNDPLDVLRFSLLERLATVKTLVILSDFDYLVCDIFACLYATVRPHQFVKVHQYFVDILTSILEETESPSRDVMDAALAPLVSSLSYTAAAVSLAERVIQNAAKHILVPLCNMLNASIRAFRIELSPTATRVINRKRSPGKERSNSKAESAQLSDHHKHITDIIIKLNRLAPDVLIYVLPNLEDRCRSEDPAVRLGAVSLLAKLFTTREDMATFYPALFSEFLGRNHDSNGQVRKAVVASLGAISSAQAKLRNQINKILGERIFDIDENVRIAAIESTGQILDIVSDDVLQLVFTRLQDKMERVRSAALDLIVSFYTAFPISLSRIESRNSHETKLSSVSDQYEDTSLTAFSFCSIRKEDLEANATFICMLRAPSLPNQLVEAYVALRKTKEYESAAKIERAIFEKICSPSTETDNFNDTERGLCRLAYFLSQLSHSAYSSFCSIVRERSNARKGLQKICNLRLEGRAAPSVNVGSTSSSTFKSNSRQSDFREVQTTKSRGNIEESRQAAKELAAFFPSLPNQSHDVEKHCLQFATAIDLKIHERAVTAIDCRFEESVTNEAVADLTARLGSTSATGSFFVNSVFPRCRPFMFSSSVLDSVCQLAADISVEERLADVSTIKKGDAEEQSDKGNQKPFDMGTAITSNIQKKPRILVGLIRYFEIIGSQYSDALASAVSGIDRLITLPILPRDWSAEVVLSGLRLASNVPSGFRNGLDNARVSSVLKSLILSKGFKRPHFLSLLVKRATRLLNLMWEDKCCKAINSKKLLLDLAKRIDSFHGNVENLAAPLSALTEFAKRDPLIFKPVALKSFDFARALLNGTMNVQIKDCLSEADLDQDASPFHEVSNESSRDILRSLGRGDVETLYRGIDSVFRLYVAEVISRASKLLVYSLNFIDSSEEIGSVIETLVRNLGDRRGDVFQIGNTHSSAAESDSVRRDETGTLSFSSVSDAIMCACNRLSIGRSIIYLARQRDYFLSISPANMVTTLLVGQDEHPVVRLSFARCIRAKVMKKHLPLRWTAMMAMMAVDPVAENVASVKAMLIQVFWQRRMLLERAVQGEKKYTSQILPESVLADLIWVLANLPGAEEEDNDLPESSRCIEFLIECLCDSKEYAIVLNEYIESISIAEDATEPNGGGVKTERIRKLCKMANKVLRKRLAGRKIDLEHTRKVTLPRDFYRMAEGRHTELNGGSDIPARNGGEAVLSSPNGGHTIGFGSSKTRTVKRGGSHHTERSIEEGFLQNDVLGSSGTPLRGKRNHIRHHGRKRLSSEFDEADVVRQGSASNSTGALGPDINSVSNGDVNRNKMIVTVSPETEEIMEINHETPDGNEVNEGSEAVKSSSSKGRPRKKLKTISESSKAQSSKENKEAVVSQKGERSVPESNPSIILRRSARRRVLRSSYQSG